jgi:hypothetical protein
MMMQLIAQPTLDHKWLEERNGKWAWRLSEAIGEDTFDA